jgi:hypothetical protein
MAEVEDFLQLYASENPLLEDLREAGPANRYSVQSERRIVLYFKRVGLTSGPIGSIGHMEAVTQMSLIHEESLIAHFHFIFGL